MGSQMDYSHIRWQQVAQPRKKLSLVVVQEHCLFDDHIPSIDSYRSYHLVKKSIFADSRAYRLMSC
jgi:hypothetical protein